MRSIKTLALLAVLAVLSAACGIIGESTESTGSPTTTAPRNCLQVTMGTAPINTGDTATDAITLSGEIFRCSDEVVVVPPGDTTTMIAAAQLGAALRAPVLLPHPQLSAELGRLSPKRIHVFGELELLVPPGAEVENQSVESALEAAAEALDTNSFIDIPATPDSSTIVETIKAITAGDRVARPNSAIAGTGSVVAADVIGGLASNRGTGPVWVVDVSRPETLILASASTHAVDATVVAADLDDLFRYPELGPALSGYPETPFRLIGSDVTLDDWKLRTLIRGDQIPGGGFELFPEHIKRRFVAFYGHPRSETLGAMGQVTPEQALDMMRNGGRLTGYSPSRCLPSPCQGTVQPGLLDGYAADGAHVVPTFNYIASVAHPSCRSSITSIEAIQPAVDVAAANGGYVMLDLQPGSSRFIEQAPAYEELLKLPHVSLALDPEWRCGWPGQTEFNRIGTTTAAEINEVINWLADLVNSHALPQKLLLIQQFRMDMIQDRDQIVQRPEIQVVIQMDGEGQGNLTVKDNTWRGVTANTENNHWRWGFKNFFVRDHANGPYSPADTLDRVPVPVYISYQ